MSSWPALGGGWFPAVVAYSAANDHNHSAAQIVEGTLSGIQITSVDIWSDSWDGGVPADLSLLPVQVAGGGPYGFYIDASAGVMQAATYHAGTASDPFNYVSLGASGLEVFAELVGGVSSKVGEVFTTGGDVMVVWGQTEVQIQTGGTGIGGGATPRLRVSATPSLVGDWTSAGDFDPDSDNVSDLGDATLTWRRGYFYDLYDEAGNQRIDLGTGLIGAWTSAGDFTIASGAQLFLDDGGTATNPALAFNSATGHGLFIHAGGALAFATGGSLRARIDSTGLIMGVDLDMQSNDIDDVATIDGGGDAVIFGDDIDLQAKKLIVDASDGVAHHLVAQSGTTGLWVEPSTNPSSGEAIFGVKSSGAVNRFEVHHGASAVVVGTAGMTRGGNTVWDAGNDGAGSGMDADTVDGSHASAFATSGHTHSIYATGRAGTTGTSADMEENSSKSWLLITSSLFEKEQIAPLRPGDQVPLEVFPDTEQWRISDEPGGPSYRQVLDLVPVRAIHQGNRAQGRTLPILTVVAEQVAGVLPEAFKDRSNHAPLPGQVFAPPPGVDWQQITAALLGVVKDHDEQIATLRETIDALPPGRR